MNEQNGKMLRLKEAKENNEKVKIFFQYPAVNKPTIKSGKVLSVFEDSFYFDEIRDGRTCYSYNFITEIQGDKE